MLRLSDVIGWRVGRQRTGAEKDPRVMSLDPETLVLTSSASALSGNYCKEPRAWQ
jgi:hypothetical protein